jgi:hypothetical protein
MASAAAIYLACVWCVLCAYRTRTYSSAHQSVIISCVSCSNTAMFVAARAWTGDMFVCLHTHTHTHTHIHTRTRAHIIRTRVRIHSLTGAHVRAYVRMEYSCIRR